jgi:hypothetical protein
MSVIMAEYYTVLNNMINLFKTQNTKVIITGIVWENDIKESIHKQIALEKVINMSL